MKYLGLLGLLITLSTAALSNELCQDLAENVHVGKWVKSQKEANDARGFICQYMGTPSQENYDDSIAQLNLLKQSIINQSSELTGDSIKSRVDLWVSSWTSMPHKEIFKPIVSDRTAFGNGVELQALPLNIYEIDQNKIVKCNCHTAIKDLDRMSRDVFIGVSQSFSGNIKKLQNINEKWQSFLTNAREQTYWDIGATSLLNRAFGLDRQDNSDFKLPPKAQWFFMRPNAVLDNVGTAIDGQELKESIAVEVVGINFWEEDSCGFFSCGLSVTVNYADRAGVESIGWGIMVHIENSYSIGMSKFSGDTGFFVTVDLLKLFQDKKTTLSRYKKLGQKE